MIRKLILITIAFLNFSFQSQKKLEDVFENCLISDTVSNIDRQNPIIITEIDEEGNRIKTNFSKLEQLLKQGSKSYSWFITQGEEAATVVEIKEVDLETGWISLGKTFQGVFNMDNDETIEFFNPFVNYEIINDAPLFKNYPKYINDDYINYIQAGGIIKRGEADYILLTPVVFGAHEKRSIAYASSSNLEDWNFHNRIIFKTSTIPFAKKEGNIFSTGNPVKIDSNNYLILLGVEQPNGNYTSAFAVINNNLEIVEAPKEIKINGWNGESQNSFPLSVVQYKNQFRLLLHRRSKNFEASEIAEITTKNLLKTLENGTNILSEKTIHKAVDESGYLHGKADDACYIAYNDELYIFMGSEELPSEYLTSFNREYGLLKLKEEGWHHDKRSPLIVNPVNLNAKYPEFDWATDHLGGFASPIIKDDILYIFMSFGSDNPDYLISGIKIRLN